MSMSTYFVTWNIAREFVDSMQIPGPKDKKIDLKISRKYIRK